jgi:hypothetical protein
MRSAAGLGAKLVRAKLRACGILPAEEGFMAGVFTNNLDIWPLLAVAIFSVVLGLPSCPS